MKCILVARTIHRKSESVASYVAVPCPLPRGPLRVHKLCSWILDACDKTAPPWILCWVGMFDH